MAENDQVCSKIAACESVREMRPKEFLSRILHQIPLQYSLGVECVQKKYSCAAVACILRIVKREDNRKIFSSFSDLESNFDEQNDKLEILFMKRSKRGGDRWSGDVAFPGGYLDVNESDVQGVIREVSEELDLNLADSSHFQWLGRLKHIDLGQSRTITPHLFIYLGLEGPLMKLEKSEVESVEWVDICVFLNKVDLDTRVLHVGDLYSRAQGENSAGKWLFSTIATALNCSSVYFPAIKLPILKNYESRDHINFHRLQQTSHKESEKNWILWGMTFKFMTDLLRIANNNKPYFQSQLPFWFDNKQVNLSMYFWHRILNFGGRRVSRVSLVAISLSSLFGLYGLSLYSLWVGYLASVSS